MSYHPKPLGCQGCPAFNDGKSFVRPTGPKDAKIVLVGQGPGQDEALDGQPFVGPSGKKLDSWLVRAGIRRHECAVGNVVWCWLPGNRPPTQAEVEYCGKAHWKPWLASLEQARVVVAIGVPAATALLGKGKAKAGFIEPYHQGYILNVAHPAFILRGNFAEEPLQVEYLKIAKEIADGLRPNLDPEAHLPRDIISNPRLPDLTRWKSRLSGEGVAIDLETAGDHIRLVGMCDLAPPHSYLAFPIRTQGGGSYWGDDLGRAVEWLWDFLSDPTIKKVGHNAQAFDIPMLERNGFIVGGFHFDTMLGMHIAHTGVPKDLETLARLYLKMPSWKAMVKGDLEGEGK